VHAGVSEGSVGVGTSVDGAIVIVALGNRDPLGCGELLFQVTSDGLLLLSEGGGAPVPHPGSCVWQPRQRRASYSRYAVAAAA
jgi:hypothetical protein